MTATPEELQRYIVNKTVGQKVKIGKSWYEVEHHDYTDTKYGTEFSASYIIGPRGGTYILEPQKTPENGEHGHLGNYGYCKARALSQSQGVLRLDGKVVKLFHVGDLVGFIGTF